MSALVIAAHPDDEIIGAGITMQSLSLPNLKIIHVTDGVPNDLRYAHWAGFSTLEKYANARRHEALSAHKLIGISEKSVIRLGFVDQQLSRQLVQLTKAFVELIQEQQPEVIITHAYEGGHPDHDAVSFASQNAIRLIQEMDLPFPILVEMTGYFSRDQRRIVNEFAQGNSGVMTMVLRGEEARLKRELYDCYESQLELLNTFPVDKEKFRLAPKNDYLNLPIVPEILYDQYELSTTSGEWAELSQSALQLLDTPMPLHHNWNKESPDVGSVNFGDFARIEPISKYFGYDRGTPIDRPFIESFLSQNKLDIRGRVLEVGDDTYTKRYGDHRVTQSDVLHIQDGYPGATIIGDLSSAPQIPDKTFDCLILTQVLVVIFDLHATVKTLHRILKPGGVALITVPGITNVDSGEWHNQWMWSFTPNSLRRLLHLSFPHEGVHVHSRGNVFTAISFLQGLSAEDIERYPIGPDDPNYPQTVMARAVKELE